MDTQIQKQNNDKMTLKRLIQMLPFSEEIKAQLLEILDKLTPDQRYELTDLCWDCYEQIQVAEHQYKTDKAILEMAKGGKGYTPADFNKMGEDLVNSFKQKLGKAEDLQKIKEVKQQLGELKTQPLSQDKAVSSPLASPSQGGPLPKP